MTSTHARPRVPKADTAIYAGLSQRFRAGDLYAFSYENGTWTTWTTEHDFEATERNGKARCCCAPHIGGDIGPTDWTRADLVAWLDIDERKPRAMSKAQVVARLRSLIAANPTDWERAVTDLVNAA